MFAPTYTGRRAGTEVGGDGRNKIVKGQTTLRVLLVISKYLPEYTGAAFRLHSTYKRLHARDRSLTWRVLCNSVEFHGHASYDHDGVPVERISSGLSGDGIGPLARLRGTAKTYLESMRTLGALRRRDFDLLHVVGTSASTSTAIRWACRNRVPLVVELVTPEATPLQGLPGMRPNGSDHLQRRTAVVAISESLGRSCARIGLTRNVWVRPNPVDAARFFPDVGSRGRLRVDLTPFGPDDRVLSAVAKFMPRKNQIFLLDVLACLPNRYKLVLAGPVVGGGPMAERDHGYLRLLRQRIEELDLADRVHLVPEFVDAADYIKLADIYCMPNQTEGLVSQFPSTFALRGRSRRAASYGPD